MTVDFPSKRKRKRKERKVEKDDLYLSKSMPYSSGPQSTPAVKDFGPKCRNNRMPGRQYFCLVLEKVEKDFSFFTYTYLPAGFQTSSRLLHSRDFHFIFITTSLNYI